MRLLNPHSLSYHAKTFTMRSPETIVSGATKTAECGLPTMSWETIGSSMYCKIPRRDPSDADFMAALTVAALTGFWVCALTSITDPAAIGTRIEIPSILPWREGITRPIALAAPVLVGIIE